MLNLQRTLCGQVCHMRVQGCGVACVYQYGPGWFVFRM